MAGDGLAQRASRRLSAPAAGAGGGPGLTDALGPLTVVVAESNSALTDAAFFTITDTLMETLAAQAEALLLTFKNPPVVELLSAGQAAGTSGWTASNGSAYTNADGKQGVNGSGGGDGARLVTSPRATIVAATAYLVTATVKNESAITRTVTVYNEYYAVGTGAYMVSISVGAKSLAPGETWTVLKEITSPAGSGTANVLLFASGAPSGFAMAVYSASLTAKGALADTVAPQGDGRTVNVRVVGTGATTNWNGATGSDPTSPGNANGQNNGTFAQCTTHFGVTDTNTANPFTLTSAAFAAVPSGLTILSAVIRIWWKMAAASAATEQVQFTYSLDNFASSTTIGFFQQTAAVDHSTGDYTFDISALTVAQMQALRIRGQYTAAVVATPLTSLEIDAWCIDLTASL